MKRFIPKFIGLCVMFVVSLAGAQVPNLIHYQGRLVDGTTLVNGPVALELSLYDANSGGNLLYTDSSTVTVSDGLYSTYIGDHTTFGSLHSALTNAQVWLQVVVNGTPLLPRERLVAVPYARAVYGLGIGTNHNVVVNPSLTNMASGFGTTVSGGSNNRATGAHATISGGRAGWIGDWSAESTIGGGRDNVISNVASAAVISGGARNVIESFSSFSVIAGGIDNLVQSTARQAVIGGGERNRILTNADHATIAGGSYNLVSGAFASISGGEQNIIETSASAYSFIGGGQSNSIVRASHAVVAGGQLNRITSTSHYAVIAGGAGNQVAGAYGMVAGGYLNFATNHAFAAGRRAKAENTGAFVWADSIDADFTSTLPNQFLVRASGGVGINTNNPRAALHVRGEAMIGNNPQPARFGMQRVNANTSVVLFSLPGPLISMSWNDVTRTLTVSNGAPYSVQAAISMMRPGSTDVAFNVTDLGVNMTLSMSNPINDAAVWQVQVGSDDRPYGFSFNGTGWGHMINGLVTYWD